MDAMREFNIGLLQTIAVIALALGARLFLRGQVDGQSLCLGIVVGILITSMLSRK